METFGQNSCSARTRGTIRQADSWHGRGNYCFFVGRNPPHLRTPPQLTINGGVDKRGPFRPTRISPPQSTINGGNWESAEWRKERHSALQGFHSARTRGTIRQADSWHGWGDYCFFVGRNPPHLRTPPQSTVIGGVAKGTPFRPTRIPPTEVNYSP